MKKTFHLLVILIFYCVPSQGTHLRGGQITVKQLEKNNYTVSITVTVFTNTKNTSVLFGGEDDYLDFGDGNGVLIPTTANVQRPDLGPDIAMASYTVMHTYASSGLYLISYSEPTRNEAVFNLDDSILTRFYIETSIVLIPDRIYETPEFLATPIFYGILREDFNGSVTCKDANNYKLLYEIATPRQNRNQYVNNYYLPPTYNLNKYNGALTWDTKFKNNYQVGEFLFAVKVLQFDSTNRFIGYISRDFQIILTDEQLAGSIKDDKDLDENNRIYLPPQESMQIKLIASSSEASQLALTAYSELLTDQNAFSFQTYDSIIETKTCKIGALTLRNITNIVRENPYPIIIRMSYEKSGSQRYYRDLAYLFYTKDVDLKALLPDGVVILGTEEFSNEINVYPNPTDRYLTIDFPEITKDIKITIQDTNGRTIPYQTIHPHCIDLNHASSGTYLLLLQENDKPVKTKRIIKK